MSAALDASAVAEQSGQRAGNALGPRDWAGQPADEVLKLIGSRLAGLTGAEAAAVLARAGPNELPRPPRPSWVRELAGQFVHFFAILLWIAAALAWAVHMPALAWAIVAVIVINGLFSFWQQYQAERAVEALAALLPQQVTVRREGEELLVPAAAIVPGDILILSEGEAIPADARLITAERLRIDLASLTGESRPVPRSARAVSADRRAPAELPNLVFAGTVVAAGRGEAVVFGTGAATQFGRIAVLTHGQTEPPSPLRREIIRITRLITVLAVSMGCICFLVSTLVAGLSWVDGFLFALGIIVANVPEGLLPTLTLALAMGVRRMAARKALVKRLEKVETLGATTVIVTDKTGTLTENEMTVRQAWVSGCDYRFIGVGYAPQGVIEPLDTSAASAEELVDLLRTAALCCDARLVPPEGEKRFWSAVGDPTEAALLVAAAKAGISAADLANWPRLGELPFDSARKRMTTIQGTGDHAVACVKGALSEVLPRCSALRWHASEEALNERLRAEVEAAHRRLADLGFRVLAVAQREVDPTPHAQNGWCAEDVECDLTLLGLAAMEDPPRPEVPAAIAACREAGIRVIMATGDDGRTAAAIGREIGLVSGDAQGVTGAELEALADAELDELLARPDLLFSRVSPEHKLRLVEALQRREEVVAVTGDGVNDAPALKRADIGVAMGISGTDVAREAADLVLADDNFASIVAAVEEGRAVYDNIRKFATYVLASNVPEIVPFLAFVLLRIPLPLTVMQILAVDLGTDLVPSLALGAERPEQGVMRRPPRPRQARLLDAPTVLRAYAWLGMIEAALGLAGFFFVYWLSGWRPGLPLAASGPLYATATTMSLTGIVACQIGNLLACRSAHESVLRLPWTGNRLLYWGIACEVCLLLLLIYTPPLAAVFGLAPLGPAHWLLLATFGPVLLLLEEGRKWLVHRKAA